MAEPILPENLQVLRNKYMDPETGKIGLTQEELAEILDVSLSSVKKWESGESIPNTDAIAALCELYQTELYFSHKVVHPLIIRRKQSKETPEKD